MTTVFISYNRQSEDFTKVLAGDIESMGLKVWFDQEVSGGQSWWDKILFQIRESDIFVFVLDAKALSSTACIREFGYAADLGKPVLPVLASSDVSINLLPPALSKIQFVDYRERNIDAALRLARAFITIPPPAALPYPLPAPPEAPISYLGNLSEQVESTTTLNYKDQSALLLDLKRALQDQSAANDAMILLEKFRKRHDLFAYIRDEIDALRNYAITGSVSTSSSVKATDETPVNKTSMPPQSFTNSTGMKFVLVQAGTFMMGSNKVEHGQPVHQATIRKTFYLQTTQVTQGQWGSIMGENPSSFKDCGEDCPVEQVSWNDVKQFLTRLNQNGDGEYRLPTEAEWDYAARNGGKVQTYAGGERLDELGWYKDNSRGKTHQVGQLKPNEFGLYDMSGNVWEWVEDDWHDSYQGAPKDGRAWIDKPRGTNRVIRGGSWVSDARRCSAATRSNCALDDHHFSLGFRLAMSATDTS